VKRAEEIRTRMAAIRSDLDALEAIEDPSDDDHVRLDGLLGEWDDLKVELEPLAERESRVAAGPVPGGQRRERGAPGR
jgi:hypothetical protein